MRYTTAMTSMPDPLSPTGTVYSVIWPRTRTLIHQVLTTEADALMARHEGAHTKRQDGMHATFFARWQAFAAGQVNADWSSFPETYPSAGSSEAIREVLNLARAKDQDLVIFNGEYEGYEALASPAGTTIHRLDRACWRAQLAAWETQGAPWGARGAQVWLSQPSAIDGTVWAEFDAFLQAVAALPRVSVWVDLAYLGTVPGLRIDLTSPVIAGVAFSLSKVYGTYYRRIGGLFARTPVPGLWGNRWFKSLDALYLGERLLTDAETADTQAARIAAWVHRAHDRFQSEQGAAWRAAGIVWSRAAVPLLVVAEDPSIELPSDHPLSALWSLARRGTLDRPAASRRLCITPLIEDGLAATR